MSKGFLYGTNNRTSGGTLTVEAPSGVTVIATNEAIGKTYKRFVGSDGTVTFKGLASGVWSITMTDGDSVSAPMTIELTTDYAISLKFFSAEIIVTYPAKSTCVCSHETLDVSFTDKNDADVEKTVTFVVPAKGKWIVSISKNDGSGESRSKTIEITAEGQVENVPMNYALVLFDGTNGGDNTSETGGWTNITASTGIKLTVTETEISFRSGSNGTKRLVGTVNSIDFSPYSTLYIEGVYNANVESDNYACRLLSKRDTSSSSEVGLRRLPHETKDVVSIDLTTINSRSALWVALSNSSADNPSIIYRCWAE